MDFGSKIYLKNVPKDMSWWQMMDFVENLGLPRPIWCHMHQGGLDVTSCFLHFDACGENELQLFCGVLNANHFLTHRALAASVAVPAVKKPRAPRLKGCGMAHTGSCRGRGRKKQWLQYHGYYKFPSGDIPRRECECCKQPWPPCPTCFES